MNRNPIDTIRRLRQLQYRTDATGLLDTLTADIIRLTAERDQAHAALRAIADLARDPHNAYVHSDGNRGKRDVDGALMPIERDEPDRRQPGESLGAQPTTYVRAVDLATELGIGPADVVRIAGQLPGQHWVADAHFPIRAQITNHTADAIRRRWNDANDDDTAHQGCPIPSHVTTGPDIPGDDPEADDAAVRAGIAIAQADDDSDADYLAAEIESRHDDAPDMARDL